MHVFSCERCETKHVCASAVIDEPGDEFVEHRIAVVGLWISLLSQFPPFDQTDIGLSATYCTGPYGKFAVDLKDYEVCVISM